MQRCEGAFRAGLVASLFAIAGSLLAANTCEAQSSFKLELQPDLLLGEETGVSFGVGLHVAVNSKGVIYVGDWMNRNVRVFSADGVLQETIGRSGQGPGEFAAIHQVIVGRNDSLYVFDANARRISVYAPGKPHTLAYTRMISNGSVQGHPGRFFVPADARKGFLVVLIQQGPRTLSVHQLDHDGKANPRPVLEGKSSESTVRTAGGGTEIVRTSPLFARTGLVGLTPADELYYGWSDNIDLAFHDVMGNWVGVFRANAPRLQVTARDVAYELEGSSELRRRALQNIEPPKTKPAVHTVMIDDKSWIWTGRYTADPSKSEWWVTQDRGSGESAILSLPEKVRLQVVRNGHAYAISTDDDGAPTVVRYAIKTTGT